MNCSTTLRRGARGLLTISVLAGALGGCAHRPSEQLVDARRAYEEAEESPARHHRPQELAAARGALDRAEEAHDAAPRSERERRLASEAERKAIVARAHGEADEAHHDVALDRRAEQREAAAERREEQREAAEERREERRDHAEERREAAEDRREARREAPEQGERARTKRSAAALQNLASVATVREEPRGVVITLSGSLLFPSGKEELSPIARQNLDQVAHALAEQPPGSRFSVAGHTDNSGSSAQNKQLSLQRARAVADQLSTAGIDRERVEVDGYGETRPIAGNDTPEGRASNRRVEIVVTPPTKTASR